MASVVVVATFFTLKKNKGKKETTTEWLFQPSDNGREKASVSLIKGKNQSFANSAILYGEYSCSEVASYNED